MQNPGSLRYLGTAGWHLSMPGSNLLVDPYFTRLSMWRVAAGLAVPAFALVQRYVPPAGWILVTHPHYDHILDDYTPKPREFAAYIQDKINFSSLILSAGLRFDLTDPNTDYWKTPYDAILGGDSTKLEADVHTQISPRLGISYPISENTVFHFGYGHYFQRPDYRYIYTSMNDENEIPNLAMNLETYDGEFGNPNLKPEKTVTYEFGVSHQLFDDYLINLIDTPGHVDFGGDVTRAMRAIDGTIVL